MDKSWVSKSRVSKEYDDGVLAFLDFAFANGLVTKDDKIKCPCAKCRNVPYLDRNTIYEHLICNGMLKCYTNWFLHGEEFSTTPNMHTTRNVTNDDNDDNNEDNEDNEDLDGMLQDIYGVHDTREDRDGVNEVVMDDNSSVSRFYKFLEDSKKELYPGCDKMTMLSFLIRLWNYKCIGGWSDKSFKLLLQLLRDSLPDGCALPENFTHCKKIISDLGLSYNKIDACLNDCMLYYKESADLKKCSRCGLSRYKDEEKKTPAKILRHFPLKPRLQRLYMSSKTATDMRWHEEERNKDGILRHPADSIAWKDFDERNPTFAAEPRNVRLGLASDGFNPFGTMSISHSTWPVVIIPYNLPPWLCMKQPHMILSLLIPGPQSPGNDIDIYLRPLIDELKELWEEGIETYDSSKKELFRMLAALLWTISDYPGLAMLSGWSTKGKMACSTCYHHTSHMYLPNWRKTCYMGHKRFLPSDHRFRKLKKDSDELRKELNASPPRTTVYKRTHTRKRNLAPVNELAAEKIDKMEKLQHQMTQEDGEFVDSGPNDIFAQVMGRDRGGRVRCYGPVKPKQFWDRDTLNSRKKRRSDDVEKNQQMKDLQDQLKSALERLAQLENDRSGGSNTQKDSQGPTPAQS